jgi:cytochrome c oxidase subunit 3/cytochrome o ubiquinol oxidase subunit 3
MAHGVSEEHRTSTGLSNAKVAMWTFLASECLLFGALISTFILYESRSAPSQITPAKLYDIPYTSVSSFILLMSSLTMVLALSAFQRGDAPRARTWLMARTAGDDVHRGQVYEFTKFVHEGFYLTKNSFATSFFVLTGTHGTHVAIGILMLLSLVGMSSRRSAAHAPGGDRGAGRPVLALRGHRVDHHLRGGLPDPGGAMRADRGVGPVSDETREAHMGEVLERARREPDLTPSEELAVAETAVATAETALELDPELARTPARAVRHGGRGAWRSPPCSRWHCSTSRPIPRTLLIVLLLGFAGFKFALVVLWFMHLKFDSVLFRRVFAGGLTLAFVLYMVVLVIFSSLRALWLILLALGLVGFVVWSMVRLERPARQGGNRGGGHRLGAQVGRDVAPAPSACTSMSSP